MAPSDDPISRARFLGWLSLSERVTAALVTVAALTLHVVFVSHAGALWRDEVNSVQIASASSLRAMWLLLEFESYPALWPLVMRGWIALGGDADGPLRALGLLGGLSLPASLWFAARRLHRGVPLASLALLAVNPEVVRWGASVRAWGLGAALLILTLVLLWEAMEQPRGWKLSLAALTAVLCVQCTYQNAVLLLVIVASGTVVALIRRERGRMFLPVAVGLIAACSLLPYADVVSRTSKWSAINEALLTSGEIMGPGTIIVQLLRVMVASGSIVLACWLGVLGVATVITLGALRAARRGGASATLAVYAAVTGPAAVAALWVFYAVLRYPPSPWYFLALLALVVVCAESAIICTASVRGRIFLVGLSVVVLASGLAPAWVSLTTPLTNVDHIAASLTGHASDEDLVVVNPWLYGISLGRYYRGPARIATIPPIDDFSVHRFDLIKQQMVSGRATESLQEQIRLVLSANHRVWVVGDLPVPQRATVPDLPPPPLPGTSWRALPYMWVWADQVAAFLGDHAIERSGVPVPANAHPLENPRLILFRGWRQ